MIYSGTAVLILVPLFFMNDRITMKEKTSTGLLTFLLVILMYIKPADMAMHGFQVPNWLPYRYSFIFSFLMIVMAFRAFENLEGGAKIALMISEEMILRFGKQIKFIQNL